MSIYLHTEADNFVYKEKEKTKKWLREVLKSEGKKEGNINIIFVENESILKLNTTYLSHNYFTDVIAFNYHKEDKINGDIYISIDTVKSNSEKYGTSFLEELHRVIVHGLLHLLGYEDKNVQQKESIERKESHYLAKY